MAIVQCKNTDGKGNITYVDYEVEESTNISYTEEELMQMTNAELSAICSELGISGSMTKANMITLIMQKQDRIFSNLNI